MRHTISIQVNDEPGVMTKISGLFARRGFNIDTITVGKTQIKGISKIIISLIGDERTIEQVEKQCNKLIDVLKVTELKPDESIIRELCIVKVNISNKKHKDDIIKYVDIYKNKIMDITSKSITIQILGDTQKIDTFLGLMESYGIKDISRTGVTGMIRDKPKTQKKQEDNRIGV